jgi:dTDP-glucose 4,6-dehydratase
MRQPANVLVTGGAGFIGSAIIRFLFSRSNFSGSIWNVDKLTYAANLSALAPVAASPRYHFLQADINDQPRIAELLEEAEIDLIIHCAAETHVDRSIDSALPFLEANVRGTLSLLEAARRFPRLHFHHVSTDEVYGSLPSEGFFTEESPYRPNSPYSATKAASDHLVRAFARTYGLSTTLSHCSNNFGPYQYPEKLIPLLITRALADAPIPVYGSGLNVRDWLYVDDHAAAVWEIARRGAPGEVYDIGGGEELTNLALVRRALLHLAEATSVPVERYERLITFVNDRPGHDFRYAICAEKIERELGWRPIVDLDEGLRRTVTFYCDKTRSKEREALLHGSVRCK